MMGVSKAVKAFKFGKKKVEKKDVHSAKKDAFLIDAVSSGDLSLVTKFITESGCSPNLRSPEGKCLVQLAIEGGHEAVVMSLFLDHSASLAPAKGLRNNKDHHADCFHISLLKTCVEKSTDSDSSWFTAWTRDARSPRALRSPAAWSSAKRSSA